MSCYTSSVSSPCSQQMWFVLPNPSSPGGGDAVDSSCSTSTLLHLYRSVFISLPSRFHSSFITSLCLRRVTEASLGRSWRSSGASRDLLTRQSIRERLVLRPVFITASPPVPLYQTISLNSREPKPHGNKRRHQVRSSVMEEGRRSAGRRLTNT